MVVTVFFFQAEAGIRVGVAFRGLGEVFKSQVLVCSDSVLVCSGSVLVCSVIPCSAVFCVLLCSGSLCVRVLLCSGEHSVLCSVFSVFWVLLCSVILCSAVFVFCCVRVLARFWVHSPGQYKKRAQIDRRGLTT